MKKASKWILTIALTPFLVFMLLAALLYFPPIQKWAVDLAADYASEKSGMNISVGEVRLKFPIDIKLGDIKALQPDSLHPQVCDTIIDARSIVCDIEFLPLLSLNVNINSLELDDIKLFTKDFIDAASIKGNITHAELESCPINLNVDTILVSCLALTGAEFDINLNDSVPEDTTESKNDWKIRAQKLNIEDTNIRIHMPGDTLSIDTYLGSLNMDNGDFNLKESIFKVASIKLNDSKLSYDNKFEDKLQQLDFNHLLFKDINLQVDSFLYKVDPMDCRFIIRNCNMKEKSGLELSNLSSHFVMNDKTLHLPDLNLTTPNSTIIGTVDFDLNTFNEKSPGKLFAKIDASIGKQDLLFFMASIPQDFKRKWPSRPLILKGNAYGNMQQMDISGININLPGAVKSNLSGYISNLSAPEHINAKFNFDVSTYDLGFVKGMLDKDLAKTINIPNGMHAKGNVNIADGSDYKANISFTEGKGSAKASIWLNTKSMAYNAKGAINNLNIGHFIRNMGAGAISGNFSAQGKGTDIFSPSTTIDMDANFGAFNFQKYHINNTDLKAALKNGHCYVDLVSNNDLLNGTISLDALLNTKNVNATLSADVSKADLYALHLVDASLAVGMCCHVDFSSDFDEYYKVQGLISDLTIADSAKTYRPDDMVFDILTQHDMTHAVIDCSDFHLNANANEGYKSLMTISERLTNEITRQIETHTIDEKAVRDILPNAKVYLTSGKNNPIYRAINYAGYGYSYTKIDMTSSPTEGINGTIAIDTLLVNNMQLDRIDFNIESDSLQMKYNAYIRNGQDNPQVCFTANLDGYITPNGTNAELNLWDKDNELGVSLAANALVNEKGLNVYINPEHRTILGYQVFKVNEDNYITMANNMRLSADMKLRADDGTGIQVYTDDDNADALQDLTISLNNFNIERLMSVIPYTPSMAGVLNGDFHTILTENNLSVSSDVTLNNFIYESCPIGNISSEFVYMPDDDGGHHIDGILFKEGKEIGTLIGSYLPEGEGCIDADMHLNRLPLDMINGFIPDQIIGLKGYGEGDFTVKGALSHLDVNGVLKPDSAYLVSVPYGVKLKFSNKPIRIVGSHVLFENYQLYANNEQPLVCDGHLDFSNMEHMYLNLRMSAKDFLIIDAKENRKSEAYGKAYVNFNAIASGELSQLQMRGKLDLLAKSDVYYILRDSPITTDNRLKELVTFTDFSNETDVTNVTRPAIDGLNIDLNINIAQGTHVKCWLNTDHSNYLDLIGGGNLRMQYKNSDLSLNGRYSMNEGEMKYSLPIIPLKTFKISDGSYIEFTGDIMNPQLNITALEETKANVNINGLSRTVDFTCGVHITQTLNNMGLEFMLDAPEEQSLHDELQMMSIEERGKLAVTMLTTGMYLADGNTSSFTMNSALSNFLQQEINNIAGSALRTLDLSVALENSTDEYGSIHTDYAFKFAKRFWNNRLSISVGGKINTGPDVSNQNKSFFDNVEFQYRLGDDSNQYLRLFYDRAVYDYLEGYTGQYGVGYMWKRKLRHFRDIFRLKESDITILNPIPMDSVQNKTTTNVEE